MKSITLFCLPFSGGNQYSFRELKPCLPENINLFPVDYPGRGRRMREPLLNTVESIVDDVFEQLKNELDKPYAIYGHSLGACVAHLLAIKFLENSLPAPLHIFVSGRGAPSVPDKHEKTHMLPKDRFYEKLREFGGTTDEVLNNEALMELFEPILRNDFRASETYTHKITAPLDIPMTLMIGEDEDFTESEIKDWQLETLQPISIKKYSGGHFFIFEHWKEIGAEISKALQ